MVLGFPEMGFESLFEARVLGLFDHVGQSLYDLLFGVVDIAQLMHEQIIECFDVFAKKAHGSSLIVADCLGATLLHGQCALSFMVPGTRSVL
jgi:hypothetical protein